MYRKVTIIKLWYIVPNNNGGAEMVIDKAKLELLMAEKQMKTRNLVKIAGISMDTLNRARRNENLQPFTVGKIANALNVSVETLILGS